MKKQEQATAIHPAVLQENPSAAWSQTQRQLQLRWMLKRNQEQQQHAEDKVDQSSEYEPWIWHQDTQAPGNPKNCDIWSPEFQALVSASVSNGSNESSITRLLYYAHLESFKKDTFFPALSTIAAVAFVEAWAWLTGWAVKGFGAWGCVVVV